MNPILKTALSVIAIYCLLFFIAEPTPVPGSTGVLGVLFVAFVGQCLSAYLLYFILLALSKDVEVDIEANASLFLLGSIPGACFFVAIVYLIIGAGTPHAITTAIGGMHGPRWVVMQLGFLSYGLVAFASPVLLFLIIWGMVKHSVVQRGRPRAMHDIESGQQFDIEDTLDDLKHRLDDEPSPWLRFIFPGVAEWYVKRQEYWHNRMADVQTSGAKAYRTTGEAYKNAARTKRTETNS